MNAKELREQYEMEVDQVTGEMSYVDWLESRLEASETMLVEQAEDFMKAKADIFRQLKEESDEVAACHVAIGLLKEENERAKQNESTMRQVLGIKTEEVDELRLQNKILSANREADEKDIIELKAEVNRLKGEQP